MPPTGIPFSASKSFLFCLRKFWNFPFKFIYILQFLQWTNYLAWIFKQFFYQNCTHSFFLFMNIFSVHHQICGKSRFTNQAFFGFSFFHVQIKYEFSWKYCITYCSWRFFFHYVYLQYEFPSNFCLLRVFPSSDIFMWFANLYFGEKKYNKNCTLHNSFLLFMNICSMHQEPLLCGKSHVTNQAFFRLSFFHVQIR